MYPVEDNEGNLYLDSSNGIHKYKWSICEITLQERTSRENLPPKSTNSIFNIREKLWLVTDYGKMDYRNSH